MENFRQNIGGYGEVGNAERVDANRIHRQAHRQRLALAVEDRPARRLHVDNLLLLLQREALIFGMIENLKLDQPADDDERPDKKQSSKMVDALDRLFVHGACLAALLQPAVYCFISLVAWTFNAFAIVPCVEPSR